MWWCSEESYRGWTSRSAPATGVAMLFLFFFILGLVIGAIHLLRDKQPRTAGHVAEVLLLWLLVITSSHTPSGRTPPQCRSTGPPATPSRPRSPSPTSPLVCPASSAT